ncbi:MAG: hypothetical protein GAK37_00081 [Pseudomonas sp.]|nr:MAG: hypothetical protein GAK37_00081 [Pseudomonas sp.]
MSSLFKATLVATLMAASLSGCIVEPAHRPPPPPRVVEVIPVAPAPSYQWVRGHYEWHGGLWVWVPGHWR